MDYIVPPALKHGDTIGLICPASPPNVPEKIDLGAAYLEQKGFKVRLGKHIRAKEHYLAGTDEQRLGDLNEMIQDDSVQAIFALRGGYGTPRLLRGVDYETLKRKPKIVSGFSDITALQLAIAAKCQVVTFSGAMPGVEFWKGLTPYTEENFWTIVTTSSVPIKLENHPAHGGKCGREGVAEGVLMGGNLAMFVANLGTPYMPEMEGAILVLEDVDEYPYRVDRMFAHLRNAGVFEKISGLALGQFTHCKPKDESQPADLVEKTISEVLEQCPCPSISGLSYGHVANKLTLPFGGRARLDTSFGGLQILTRPVC